MSWKRSTLFLFLLVFAGAMSLATTAGAVTTGPCTVVPVNQVEPPDISGPPAPSTSTPGLTANPRTGGSFVTPLLNQEGLTERPGDLLIYDNGDLATGAGSSCFPAGGLIIITYNAALTTPNPILNNGTDLDVMDSAGTSGLVISVATSVGLSTFNTPQTVITISVLQAGTHVPYNGTAAQNLLNGTSGSAIRLKNLRFDVSSLVDTTNHFVQATISTSNPVTAVLGSDQLGSGSDLETLGEVEPTVNPNSIRDDSGLGYQSFPPGLCTPAQLEFGEGFAQSFRTAISSQAVYNDVPTGDMSFIFNVTNIPSGVTVTFPSTMKTTHFGAPFVFTARSSSLTTTGGSLAVIYDTTTNTGPIGGRIEVGTANSASSESGCLDPSDDGPNCQGPKIGVAVGSATGVGTANLEVVFGPTTSAAFTGDDVNATAIPRYIASDAGVAPSRLVANGDFFTLQPLETVLLYPYVTDTLGFQTGLEVANTGNSTVGTSNIFPPIQSESSSCPIAPPTNGTLTFYFFPNGGTPFSYVATAADQAASSGAMRGLDATTGNLDQGNIFAATLDGLLTAAKQTSMIGKFDGYVMVVTSFDYGHGIGLVLSASSGATVMSSNALVVGPYEGVARGGQLGGFIGFPETLGSVTTRKH